MKPLKPLNHPQPDLTPSPQPDPVSNPSPETTNPPPSLRMRLQSLETTLKPFIEWVAKNFINIFLLNLCFQAVVITPLLMIFNVPLDGAVVNWVGLAVGIVNQLALVCYLRMNAITAAAWMDQEDHPRHQEAELLYKGFQVTTEATLFIIVLDIIGTILSPASGIPAVYAWVVSLPFDLLRTFIMFKVAFMLITLGFFVVTLYRSNHPRTTSR